MKEVKQFSKSYVLVSALYIVLGVVLIAWPATSVKMISYGLGIGMLVLGIAYGIIYFTKDNQSGFLQMDLVIGIICLALGLFLLLNAGFFMTVLPFAMGIILLLGAVVKIQNSVNMKRLRYKRWYVALIAAILIIAMAAVLLCNVLQEHVLILYIGVCLILDGLTNLVSLILIQTRVKRLARMQRKNPDVPYDQLLEDYVSRNEPKEEFVPAAVAEAEEVVPDAVAEEKEEEEEEEVVPAAVEEEDLPEAGEEGSETDGGQD